MADRVNTSGRRFTAVSEKDGRVTRKNLLSNPPDAIQQSDAPGIYASERYGMLGYLIAAGPGSYDLRLHLCENFEGVSQPGKRVFDITVNGQTMIEGLDVYAEAEGRGRPVVKTIGNVKAIDGVIRIVFEPELGRESPMLNAIELIPAAPRSDAPTP